MSRAQPPSDAGVAFVSDDAISRAQRAVGLLPARGGFGLGRRIALAVGLTWFPLFAWAVAHRLFLGGATPEPLFEHFGIHARFLVALPLFLVAESTVEAALRRVVPQFVLSGIVDDALRPAFEGILRDATRLRRSWIGLAAVGVVVALSLVLGGSGAADNHELIWTAAAGTTPERSDFAVLWFGYVARPIFLLALAAWLWRLLVMARTFAHIARLDLRLAPTHPDRAGGLGFVEALPVGLAPLFFGLSVVVAGRWGHEAMYHELDVMSLRVPAAALVLVSLAVGLFPLLAFAGRLRALRRTSRLAYGALLGDYGRAFERRWIRREATDEAEAPMLSAPEIGPVADTVALYEVVSRMRSAPISRRSLLPIALAAALPLLPVFAIQLPLKAVVLKVLAPLLGI